MTQPQHSSEPQKPKARQLNVFALLFIVLIIATVCTYIVPAGEYTRVELNGRSVVDPDSFAIVDATPVSAFGIVTAIHAGMVKSADIIFFVLIVGGAFGVLSSTGAIEAFVFTMSKRLAHREKWMFAIVMLFFALAGSFMGMAEEVLVYIPIMIPLALSLGFDVITGTAIVLMGASAGFTAAIMNPFTVGIAQGIAGLPLFSGIGLRIIIFIFMYVATVTYVYRYAMKVKKDRSQGFFNEDHPGQMAELSQQNITLTATHKGVLLCFLANFVILVFGIIKLEWFIPEIAGLFILLTIAIGLVARQSPNQLVKAFMNGASQLIAGALVIGVARAILVVLNEGRIIDTILHYSASVLNHLPSSVTAIGIFFLQAVIHFFIPSGSAQAAITIPIMAPLADLVGVTRQTAVLSFSLAEGIGNIIFPTSGYFMAALALAGIPWVRWAKWVLPLVLIQYAISLTAIIIAHFIGYGPF